MIKLVNLNVARFSGPDAGEFLQAQLSADIGVLEPGDSTFACYCSPRGQVFGLLLVGRVENEYLVVASSELLPSMLQRLRIFVLRSKVEISAPDNMAVYGLDDSDALPSALAVFNPASLGLVYGVSTEVAGDTADTKAWKERELLCKVSWLNPATSEKFIPQMLGFDAIGAVSFSKGCYPGQEIVARARYLGKVKRKPILLRSEIGLDVLSGSSIRLQRNSEWSSGSLLDSVISESGESLLLVVAAQEPAVSVEHLEYDGEVYRCATI